MFRVKIKYLTCLLVGSLLSGQAFAGLTHELKPVKPVKCESYKYVANFITKPRLQEDRDKITVSFNSYAYDCSKNKIYPVRNPGLALFNLEGWTMPWDYMPEVEVTTKGRVFTVKMYFEKSEIYDEETNEYKNFAFNVYPRSNEERYYSWVLYFIDNENEALSVGIEDIIM